MSEPRRLLLFIATSGFSAVINVLVRILLSRIVIYEVAVALAYLVGMAIAFLLGRLLVFDGRSGGWHKQLLRFCVVNAVSGTQVLAVSSLLTRIVFPWIDMQLRPELSAHIIGIASTTLTSYYLHRHFTFRRPGTT